MDDIIANVRYDDSLASYKTFFDHQWAKDMGKLVSGTRLEPPVDALTFHWKSIANAHLMPWLITVSLRNWAQGFLLVHPPSASRVVGAILKRLVSELGDGVSRRCQKTIRAAVGRIAHDVLAKRETDAQAAARRVRATDIWSAFINHREFVLSICGSQRLCYAGVYFAYENFVRQCTSLATGTDEVEYADGFKKQLADMRAAFGDTITDHVADQYVNVARLVRNALVHAGGRISGELRQIPHGLAVEDNVLQIMATDTSRLFEQLKGRASSLAERAVGLPAFNEGGGDARLTERG